MTGLGRSVSRETGRSRSDRTTYSRGGMRLQRQSILKGKTVLEARKETHQDPIIHACVWTCDACPLHPAPGARGALKFSRIHVGFGWSIRIGGQRALQPAHTLRSGAGCPCMNPRPAGARSSSCASRPGACSPSIFDWAVENWRLSVAPWAGSAGPRPEAGE
jgi:hypothetical protein